MGTKHHPVTGVEINDILIVRTGPVTDDERRTARLLLGDGHARWLVAAMLGRFPLAFDGIGAPPAGSRKTSHGHLPGSAARNDPRQFSLDDLFGPDDTPDDGHGAHTGP
jgi:hypothetical protein